MRRPTLLALALALVTVPGVAAAQQAPRLGTFSGTLGVKVPKGAHAEVRAIDRATGALAGARGASRSGAFSLRLPAGAYLVVGSIVRADARPAQVRLGVTLKPGQKRTKASLKKRKRRKATRRRAAAAYVQEKGQVTPGRVAVEIPPFTGGSRDADWAAFKGGLDDLLITDAVQAGEDCGVTVIEVERRGDILKELEFQQSPYVDPSTRVVRNFVLGDVRVLGTMADAPGGGVAVAVRIVDARTGRQLSEAAGALRPDAVFEDFEKFSKRVTDELCKLGDVYEVKLDVAGEGRFATHSGSGEIHATLRAKRIGAGVWRAVGSLRWEAVAFATKIARCPLIDPVVPEVPWSVTLTDAGDGRLNVVWAVQASDGTTASVDCAPDGPKDPDPPPIPGMPGTALLITGPTAFTVPYAGGRQELSGIVQDGGDGFFNAGTITVAPSGVAGPGDP